MANILARELRNADIKKKAGSAVSPDKIILRKTERNGYWIGNKLSLPLSTSFYLLKGGWAWSICMRGGYTRLGKSQAVFISLMMGQELCLNVQFSRSVGSDSLQPHGCSMPGFPVHQQLPELAQTHIHQVSDAIQPSHLLSSPSPPAFNLSQHQGLFQWVRSSYQVAKVLEFQFQHQSFQWIFRNDFLLDGLADILAIQGTLRSLLQHHSSEASVLCWSAFFIVQLSHPYMTTGKTIALTRWTIFGKLMSLLFSMQSRFVTAFLPWSKRLLISWLQ